MSKANDVEIRVGTTRSYMLPMPDPITGETIFIKVASKPRFTSLGQPGIFPKDGGK